jgi:hypothetical protein
MPTSWRNLVTSCTFHPHGRNVESAPEALRLLHATESGLLSSMMFGKRGGYGLIDSVRRCRVYSCVMNSVSYKTPILLVSSLMYLLPSFHISYKLSETPSMLFKFITLAALASAAAAQSPAYGQCGGQGWSGSKSCVSGYTCQAQGDYYSQCVPGSGKPSPTL